MTYASETSVSESKAEIEDLLQHKERIAELEAQVAARHSLASSESERVARVVSALEAERDAALARVKELEANSPEAAKYWRREHHEEYARRVAVEDLSRTTCDRYLTDIGPTEHVLCCDKESSRRVVALVEERDAEAVAVLGVRSVEEET